MSNEKDGVFSILNMDITELLQPEVKTEDVVIENPDDEGKKNLSTEDEDVNINDILSTANEDNKKNEKSEDTDESPAPVIVKDNISSSSEPFTLVFARYLLEQGNISNLDEDALKAVIDKDGEQNALSFLIQNEVDYNKTAILENYDTYTKEYVQLRELGINPTEAAESVQVLEQLDSITNDDLAADDAEDLRKQILSAHLKSTTSFSEDRIKKMVSRIVDLGEDLDEAKEALVSLKDIKKKEIEDLKKNKITERANHEKEVNDTLNNLKTKINSLEEIVPNLKLTKQSKQKIEDLLTKPIKQTEQGQLLNGVWSKRMEDPMDFDIKLAYLIELGAFDGKWDKLIKKTESKVTEELKNKMNAGISFLGGTNHTTRTKKESDSSPNAALIRALNL